MSGDAGRQSFVDLGCGNGLLVYLLTEEGVSLFLSCLGQEAGVEVFRF